MSCGENLCDKPRISKCKSLLKNVSLAKKTTPSPDDEMEDDDSGGGGPYADFSGTGVLLLGGLGVLAHQVGYSSPVPRSCSSED